MRVDIETGEFSFQSGDCFGPATTRSGFLSSQIGRSSKIVLKNEPWCSFSFMNPADSTSYTVYFRGEVLDSINITVNRKEFGDGWNDWSEPKEMARKVANDKWLASIGLAAGADYPWGSVWSGYDSKGGFSCVVIRYICSSQ